MSKSRFGKDNPAYKHGKFTIPRFCLDCNKELNWKSNSISLRCGSCAHKGKLNGMYENYYIMSEKHKKHVAENHPDFSGKNNPNYKNGRSLKKHFCIKPKCNNEISYNTFNSGKQMCIFCSNRGIHNSHFGKPSKPNWVKYKNTWFRSNWELRFAQFLILSRIKWRYESKVFDLGNTTYTPDFYLPIFNCYIEIKGYFSDKAKKKINKFCKIYENINLIIIDEKKYMNIIGIRR